MPAITVLMPVYNAMPYLRQAVTSILTQTFTDFELIVLDDASTDDGMSYLQTLTDPRLKIISRPKSGLSVNLNHGIELSSSPFIARMDADDISEPNRLQEQWEFMQAHPQCVVCGTRIRLIDREGNPSTVPPHYTDDARIRWNLLHNSAFAHPSVIMRTESLLQAGPYRKELEPAEDYDLWLRLARIGQLANLPKPLLRYRIHPGSVSSVRAEIQKQTVRTLATESLLSQGFARDVHEAELFLSVAAPGGAPNSESVQAFVDVSRRFSQSLKSGASTIRWLVRRRLLGLARHTAGRTRWQAIRYAIVGV